MYGLQAVFDITADLDGCFQRGIRLHCLVKLDNGTSSLLSVDFTYRIVIAEIWFFIFRHHLLFLQISYKVARIAADGAPELINEIKQFLINLFQNSAELVLFD